MKKDYLFRTISKIFSELPKGRVLDLGCGNGQYANELAGQGFIVQAADMDRNRFQFHDRIAFDQCDLNCPLPFEGQSFDYVLFLETIEHLKNPFFVIGEISRVLKSGGVLIISTPNILNLGSRTRFFLDGSFDFFREPLLDYSQFHKNNLHNMHIIVWRYHELEWLLFESGLQVERVNADHLKLQLRIVSLFWLPFLKLRAYFKEIRALAKGGVDYRRIDRLLFSKEIMCGRHLIIQARKK
ncbi:MAG: class I SAM-dependent methyltransferase [Candidatus Omnitrophica bacterium]|nr:class I SAM-dependent methyltransferase [Candidatus Omnitrophota bacterium]